MLFRKHLCPYNTAMSDIPPFSITTTDCKKTGNCHGLPASSDICCVCYIDTETAYEDLRHRVIIAESENKVLRALVDRIRAVLTDYARGIVVIKPSA
jgi:hypothetical protein